MTNYSYTYEILSRGKIITKTVGGRGIEGRDRAAWDFARRETRDPTVKVIRLVKTDDPRVMV